MKNRSLNEALRVVALIITIPFTVVILSKAFGLFVGFMFGMNHYDNIVGEPGVWVLATFAALFSHIAIIASYLDDQHNN